MTAMIAVSVYGSEALRSLRFAGARLLVAVSLAIISLAFLDFLLPGSTYWRSILLYAMGLSIAFLMLNRIIVGGILGLVVAYLIDPPTRVKPPERGEQE